MLSNVNKIILSKGMSGFVCWYGVEKIFLTSIHISPLGISQMAIVYVVVSALFNVPTGILADRYGRKYALGFAALSLLASTLVAMSAHSFSTYIVAVGLWGFFYTTQHGAYEALLYDELKDEDRADQYARYSGLSSAAMWLSVFLASVIGAWVGSHYGLRSAYYVTLIPNIINFLLVFTLHEPTRHKVSELSESSFSMVKKSARFLISSPPVLAVGLIYLMYALLGFLMNEFGQLYFLKMGFSVLVIGVVNGFSGLTQAFGDVLGHRLHSVKIVPYAALIIILFMITFSLPVHLRVLGAGLFLIVVGVSSAFYTSTQATLQHQIPHGIRATTLSTLGMGNDILVIGAFLLFGLVANRGSVRHGFMAAGSIGFILLLAGSIALFRGRGLVLIDDTTPEEPLPSADPTPR